MFGTILPFRVGVYDELEFVASAVVIFLFEQSGADLQTGKLTASGSLEGPNFSIAA